MTVPLWSSRSSSHSLEIALSNWALLSAFIPVLGSSCNVSFSTSWGKIGVAIAKSIINKVYFIILFFAGAKVQQINFINKKSFLHFNMRKLFLFWYFMYINTSSYSNSDVKCNFKFGYFCFTISIEKAESAKKTNWFCLSRAKNFCFTRKKSRYSASLGFSGVSTQQAL